MKNLCYVDNYHFSLNNKPLAFFSFKLVLAAKMQPLNNIHYILWTFKIFIEIIGEHFY